MTEPKNQTTQDRLRATLKAAAPGDTGVDEFLGTLRDRIDGAETGGTVRRLDSAKSRVGSTRNRLLAAAAVVAVVAIGAVVLTTRDESPSLVTVGGPGKTTSPEPADATGWYVPEGLPAGWSVEAITTDFLDADKTACPCPSTTWLSPDGTVAIVVTSRIPTTAFDDQVFDTPSVLVDLDGVPGRVGSMGTTGSRTVIFDSGVTRSSVTVSVDTADGPSVGDTVAAAKRILADPEAAPAAGFEAYESFTRSGGVKSLRSVSVELRTPAGHRLVYSLYPSGFADNLAVYRVPELYRAEGQVASVSRFDWPAIGRSPSYTQMTGRWPGADVIVNDHSPAGSPAEGKATSDEIIAVLSRLRPVSSNAWKQFASNSPGVDTAALGVARVDDLLVGPNSSGGTTVEGFGTKFRVEVGGKAVRIQRWQPAESGFVSAGETNTRSISIYTVPSEPAVGLVVVPSSFEVSLSAASTLEIGTPVDCGEMTCALIRFTSKRPEENTLTLTSGDSTETVTVPAPKDGNAGLLTRPT